MGTSETKAVTTKEQQATRKEQTKEAKKKLNEKVSKAAKKEAKRLEKEGWLPAPGTLSIEKQEDKVMLMRQEEDELVMPRYYFGIAQSIGGTFDAARMQAMTLAKRDLISQMETTMVGLIESENSTTQLTQEEAASVVKTITASKEIVEQKLGRVIPVVEIYRKVGKNVEVQLVVAYSSEMVNTIIKDAIQKDIEKEGKDLQNKLDQLIGW